MKIKVFERAPNGIDAFVVRKEFADLMDELSITEWHPVVWIGRLFAMDQDFGEHWMDNWDERAALGDCEETGSLMVVVPKRFTATHKKCYRCGDERGVYTCINYGTCPHCGETVRVAPDGPCYSNELKRKFWTDVLDSLEIELETLFKVAREQYGTNTLAETLAAIEAISARYPEGQ